MRSSRPTQTDSPSFPSPSIVKPKTFIIKMLRTQVGNETDLSHRLISQNPKSLFYKVLGNYDILEFGPLDSIHDANKVYTEPAILGTTAFPVFYWHNDVEDFWKIISTSPTPSIVLVKLHAKVQEVFGKKTLPAILNYFSGKNSVRLYPLSGLGHYEFILIQPSRNLEDIFSILRTLRYLQIKDVFKVKKGSKHSKVGVFSETLTLPLISYNNIIQNNKWNKLEGNIKPIIKIKCIPNFELQIASSLGVPGYDILGEDDLVFTWPKAQPLKKFLPHLLKFRKKWQGNLALASTNTNLLSLEKLPACISDDGQPENPVPLKYLAETLGQLNQEGVNRYLINEIICIVGLINTFISRRSLRTSISDVINSIPSLDLILSEYILCCKNNEIEKRARIEGHLLLLTDSLRLALSQRFPGVEVKESDLGNPPLSTYSASRIIKVASSIVEHLIDNIVKSVPSGRLHKVPARVTKFKQKWHGFTYFDIKEGYQLYNFEIISLPLSDLFTPLNWATLSHEISHAYFNRVSFYHLERSFYAKLSAKIKNEKPSSLPLYEKNLRDYSWELFAHWFDYKHFYGGDIDFYMWCIWRTWLQVPRVFQNKLDYWMRSAFVKICHDWQSLEDAFREVDRRYSNNAIIKSKKIELLNAHYDYVSSHVKKLFPDKFADISLRADEVMVVNEQLYYLYHFSKIFVSSYVNSQLYDKLNNTSTNLAPDITSIQGGQVLVNGGHDPFILIREYLRYLYRNGMKDSLSSESTIALIYSLWNASS